MEREKLDQKLVAIFMLLVVLSGVLFCLLVHHNQIRTIHFQLAQFEQTDREEKASITKVSENGKYMKVEGKFSEEAGFYEIYVGIEDETGEVKGYKTQRGEEYTFYTLIPKKSLEKSAKIDIIYACDNEKILIKTNRTIGENQL